MNPTLLYLLVRSLRGRFVRSLRLLKQPKYLAGLLVFVLWMVLWLGGTLFDVFDVDDDDRSIEIGRVGFLREMATDFLAAVHLLVGLAIAVIVSLWWLIPWGKIALELKENELNLLLPAPVRRRHLIQFATLKSQPGVLVGSLIMTFFTVPAFNLGALRWFFAVWITFTIWDLHSKGRSLWLAKVRELPPTRAMRQRLYLLTLLVGFWLVVSHEISNLVGELMTLSPAPEQEMEDFIKEVMTSYGARVQQGVLGLALTPFLWLTAPFFATGEPFRSGLQGPYLSLLIPLLTLIAYNEWVVRSRVKFEEAVIDRARREAAKKDASARYWRTSLRSRMQVPFDLSSHGPPEVGVLWKNLLLVRRLSLRTGAMLYLALVAGAAVIPALLGAPAWVYGVIMVTGLGIMGITPLATGQHYRNDLRTDLLKVEMMRPWPIPGWKLIAAETLAPATVATMSAAVGAGLILAVDLGTTLGQFAPALVLSEEVRITPDGLGAALGAPQPLVVPLFLLGALPLAAAVACISSALQNLAVLVFPAWTQLGQEKQQGAATFGQNLLVFTAISLCLLLCLLPGAAIVGGIALVQVFLFGVRLVAWEFPLFGVLAATPVFAAAWLLVRAGGRLWDRLDPSREILEQAG